MTGKNAHCYYKAINHLETYDIIHGQQERGAEMERYKEIDSKIQEGYALIQRNNFTSGCEIWLNAWEEVKGLFAAGAAEDIFELNDVYKWAMPISNYAQMLEMELHNAGVDDKEYHKRRIAYCKELVEWCKDEMTANNARCSMAEAYFELGDIPAGDRIFQDLISEDPDRGENYVSWAGCYLYNTKASNRKKAEDILLAGQARDGLRGRLGILEQLTVLYEDMGKADKAEEYRQMLVEQGGVPIGNLFDKPAPVKVVKVGRNEPCPCGSEKKYKKCCGA